jgi:hypothetical protein
MAFVVGDPYSVGPIHKRGVKVFSGDVRQGPGQGTR